MLTDEERAGAASIALRLPRDAVDDVALWLSLAGLTMEDIRSRAKPRHLVEARRELAAVMRARGMSLSAIGRAMDRDHTTILTLLGGKVRKRAPASETQG